MERNFNNDIFSNLRATMKADELDREAILEICKSNDEESKSQILFYSNLPIEAINTLREDPNIEVKKSFAWTHATKGDLDTLILDNDKQVRWRAAMNINITEEQLFTLIKQDDFLVNRNIAISLSTPLTILEELIKNENETISDLAREHFQEEYFYQECKKGEMNLSDKEEWNKVINTHGLDAVINALEGSWSLTDIANGYAIITLNVFDVLNIPDNVKVDINKFDIDVIDYIEELRCFDFYKDKSPNTLAIANGEKKYSELRELFECFGFNFNTYSEAWMPIVTDRNTEAFSYLKDIVNSIEHNEEEELSRSR